jgi:hypothetical protein
MVEHLRHGGRRELGWVRVDAECPDFTELLGPIFKLIEIGVHEAILPKSLGKVYVELHLWKSVAPSGLGIVNTIL